MQQTLRGGVLAVALAFGLAGPVRADVPTWNTGGSQCGGAAFQTCFSGTVSIVDGNLRLTVMNTDVTYQSVFMGVGFFNLPSGTELSLESATIDGTDVLDDPGWSTPANDLNGYWGDYDNTVGGAAPDNHIPVNGVNYLETVVLTFSVTGDVTAEEVFAQAGIGVHAIAGPNNCSTKFGVAVDGTKVDAGDTTQNCVSVPEPMSGGLIAMGLAGLVFIRRRRGWEIVAEG